MLNLWRQLFSLDNKPEMYKYFNLKLCILLIDKNVKIISSMYVCIYKFQANNIIKIILNMLLIFTLVVLIYYIFKFIIKNSIKMFLLLQ